MARWRIRTCEQGKHCGVMHGRVGYNVMFWAKIALVFFSHSITTLKGVLLLANSCWYESSSKGLKSPMIQHQRGRNTRTTCRKKDSLDRSTDREGILSEFAGSGLSASASVTTGASAVYSNLPDRCRYSRLKCRFTCTVGLDRFPEFPLTARNLIWR